MLMLIQSCCEIVVICRYHPGHFLPKCSPAEASCYYEYIVTSTTAPKGLLYCRFALPSPPLELWCLCYLILGFHLATAVDIGEKQNKGYNNIHSGALHHRLTYKTNSGNSTPLVTIQHSSEHLHKRSNEINDKLTNHRQSNILIASLQSHIKHFSKIRTTEGGFKEPDQRQGRDISDTAHQELDDQSTSSSTTTLKPWIHPDAIATPAETAPPGPMSPVHPTAMDTMGSNVVVFVLVLALVLATLGVLTCILSTYRYRTGGGGGGGMGGRARSELPSDTPGLLGSNANLPESQHSPYDCGTPRTNLQSGLPVPGIKPATSRVVVSRVTAEPPLSMLALPGGMCEEREVAALRDRHVRLKSVRTDMELDLPPNIRLPDGEELPYGCATRLHIRDPEQESEIYQKCVRPPPNRTVFDGESPPPYRSSSAGLLSHATPGSIDWAQDTPPEKVIRCHSMSSGSSRSGSTPSTAPAVVVPARSRRLSAFSDAGAMGGALSQLTMVPCHRGAEPPV